MLLLPGLDVVGRELIVRVAGCLGGHVDDGQRHHELVDGNGVRPDAALGEVYRRIEVRAGVLEHRPFRQIEAVGLEPLELLQRDAGRAEERRKLGRVRVGQIDDAGELREGLGLSRGRQDRFSGDYRSHRRREKTTARQLRPHMLHAAWCAHAFLPPRFV